jgi:hypothetical protein
VLKGIEVIPLHKVKPHEQILPDLVHLLKGRIRADGFLRDPIIIDSKTNIALDGMHRLEALRSLSAKFALVSRVDYESDAVDLSVWLRLAMGLRKLSLVERISSELGYSLWASPKVAMNIVDQGRADASVISDDEAFILPSRRGLVDVLMEFEKLCNRLGYTLFKGHPSETLCLFEKSGGTLLYTRKPTKMEVISAGKTRNLFPGKSTRHIIQLRPLNVCFPLQYLRGANTSIKAANEFLTELLQKKSFKILGPRSKVGKRIYEETVMLFSPKGVETN